MTIRDVALSVKRWALANKMMGPYPLQPTVNQQVIREVFGRAGVPAATQVLQSRGISYIGINEHQNTIIIFTEKKLSIREQKMFENYVVRVNGQPIALAVVQSGTAQVGGPPPAPPGIAPFYVHNGRYTCGSSIYLGSEKGAGTLGCLVRDAGGTLYGLSNNHVTGGANYAVPGLPIVAPGMVDVAAGGRDPETIGHHFKAYPFIDGYPDIVDATNNLDAAIFKIANADRVSSMQRDAYDTPTDCLPLQVGMNVEKVGRTSGRTRGTVIAELFDFEPVHCQIDIIRGLKVLFYKSHFKVKSAMGAFSYGGDSGSLVITTDNGAKKAVGIVVAGNNEGLSFVLSLHRILTYFDVNLVSGHNT